MSKESNIRKILADVPDPRINRVGPYWKIGFAWLAGARKDGEALARDMRAQYYIEGGTPIHAVPESPAPSDPEADYKAMYEALKRQTEGKPEEVAIPFFLSGPPGEVSDVLAEAGVSHLDSYERVNETLLPLFAQAKGYAEISRNPDCKGVFNGKTTIEWERKAQSINESIRWNAGRKVETI